MAHVAIQTPQTQAALGAEFRLREPLGQLSITPYIQPVVLVADLAGPQVADRGYPRECFGFCSSAAAGAGQNSECYLQGATNVGKIFHVISVLFSKITIGAVQFRTGNADTAPAFTLQNTKQYTDQRVAAGAGSPVPDGIIGVDANIGPRGNIVSEISFPGADSVILPLNVVLGNGEWILMANTTGNEELSCTWTWIEYLLEER